MGIVTGIVKVCIESRLLPRFSWLMHWVVPIPGIFSATQIQSFS